MPILIGKLMPREGLMAAPGTCGEPGIICWIAGVAQSIIAHPWIALVTLLVLVLSLVGLRTIREYYAEHGFRRTVVRGWELVRDTGYSLASAVKFSSMGTATGVGAAFLAFLAGIAHLSPYSHKPHGPDASSTEKAHGKESRALVPLADVGREAVAMTKARAQAGAELADPLKDAARFANDLRHRKVEVHFGGLTLIAHPEDRQDDARSA